jgi:hypothetical protein
MEWHSVMQCLDTNIQQMIEDRLLALPQKRIVNCLNPPLQKCARNSFNFDCFLHKYEYISTNFESSYASPVFCFLPLNNELAFRHLQTTFKKN